MADILTYIPNYDLQIYPFCRLPLVVETRTLTLMNQPIKIQFKSLKLLS